LLYRLEQQVFDASDGLLNIRSFHNQITKNNSLILVAAPLEEKNSLYGYILVLRHRKSARIYSLAVDSCVQNQGIARSLIQVALDQINHPSIQKVNLEVRESNIPAINLYQSLGFIKKSEKRDYYALNQHAIIMAKIIDTLAIRNQVQPPNEILALKLK
jgi:ribosomal-protein-alanine N-acetyltransferase